MLGILAIVVSAVVGGRLMAKLYVSWLEIIVVEDDRSKGRALTSECNMFIYIQYMCHPGKARLVPKVSRPLPKGVMAFRRKRTV